MHWYELLIYPSLYGCISSYSSLLLYCVYLIRLTGTTIKDAGSQEAFRRVDYSINAELARAAKQHGIEQFHLVSSVGADAMTSNFYLRTKGEIENYVSHILYTSSI